MSLLAGMNMQPHIDIAFLLAHLPNALHHLLHHEDAAIVNKELLNINLKPPELADHSAPLISIEKSLDPMVERSVHNIGLLLHDYVNQLPVLDASSAKAEKLLQHWQKILLEQPQRLSTAHSSSWNEDKTKTFWRHTLAKHRAELGISDDVFIDAWDDWQRTSGIGHATGHPLQLQMMQQKQWQDLVIRSRLHHETVARSMEW